jgi:hypothetical protein
MSRQPVVADLTKEQKEERFLEVARSFAEQRIKYTPVLYKCLSCGKLFKRNYFVTPFTKGLPKIDYCDKECRKFRTKLHKENIKKV